MTVLNFLFAWVCCSLLFSLITMNMKEQWVFVVKAIFNGVAAPLILLTPLSYLVMIFGVMFLVNLAVIYDIHIKRNKTAKNADAIPPAEK